MLWVAQERLDPRLGAVVGRHVALDEQAAEQDADANVGEGAEGEELARRVDEAADLLVLVLHLLDDRPDGLLDEREPDLLLRPGHPGSVGDDGDVDALGALAAAPATTALLFDVDGTLAPIVARPEDARVPAGTQAELRRLAGRYALVGCVSGRAADDARRVVGVPELTYVGEHGLELEPDAHAWSERIHAFAQSAPWPAEQKALTIAFHYRTATDREAARETLERVDADARAAGFRTRWGRLVLEVLPPVEASKRTAVEHLLERTGLRRALYAGDDATDLDAFGGLDGLDLAVRVAVASHEALPALRERADLVVESPAALVDLLRRL